MKIVKAFTSQAKAIFGMTQDDKLNELYGKRVIFGNAIVKTPWYSLSRPRNLYIASGF